MTYRVLGRRAAQLDTQQPTQMSRQLGGVGGIRPPNQRTLLGHSEDPGPEARHGMVGRPGQYQSMSGDMQMSMPAYQAGSPGKPFYVEGKKKEAPSNPPPRREEDTNRQQQEYYPPASRKPPSKKNYY